MRVPRGRRRLRPPRAARAPRTPAAMAAAGRPGRGAPQGTDAGVPLATGPESHAVTRSRSSPARPARVRTRAAVTARPARVRAAVPGDRVVARGRPRREPASAMSRRVSVPARTTAPAVRMLDPAAATADPRAATAGPLPDTAARASREPSPANACNGPAARSAERSRGLSRADSVPPPSAGGDLGRRADRRTLTPPPRPQAGSPDRALVVAAVRA